MRPLVSYFSKKLRCLFGNVFENNYQNIVFEMFSRGLVSLRTWNVATRVFPLKYFLKITFICGALFSIV